VPEAHVLAIRLTILEGTPPVFVYVGVPATRVVVAVVSSIGAVGSWRGWAQETEGWLVKERRSLSEVQERLLQAGKA
jgi:hypothetical protein